MPVATQSHYAAIISGGVTYPLNGPAWDCPDYSPLWGVGPFAGEDAEVPGAHGVVPQDRVRAAWHITLPLTVYGHRTPDDAVNANAETGLQANMATVRGWISTTTDRTLRVVWPDGTTTDAACRIHGPLTVVGFSPTVVRTTLEILVYGGQIA